ncbi:hypothetical protein MUP59_01755 [Candidatus Bathyarchaeota archaeon]|nr:hypothetical protein [Candidatus Bathyarchaeota archaeon]
MNDEVAVKRSLCPPHHWYISQSSSEGVALAKCMRQGCFARQFQVIWVSKEAVEEANELNREWHYPQIQLSQRAKGQLLHFLNAPITR